MKEPIVYKYSDSSGLLAGLGYFVLSATAVLSFLFLIGIQDGLVIMDLEYAAGAISSLILGILFMAGSRHMKTTEEIRALLERQIMPEQEDEPSKEESTE